MRSLRTRKRARTCTRVSLTQTWRCARVRGGSAVVRRHAASLQRPTPTPACSNVQLFDLKMRVAVMAKLSRMHVYTRDQLATSWNSDMRSVVGS